MSICPVPDTLWEMEGAVFRVVGMWIPSVKHTWSLWSSDVHCWSEGHQEVLWSWIYSLGNFSGRVRVPERWAQRLLMGRVVDG